MCGNAIGKTYPTLTVNQSVSEANENQYKWKNPHISGISPNREIAKPTETSFTNDSSEKWAYHGTEPEMFIFNVKVYQNRHNHFKSQKH